MLVGLRPQVWNSNPANYFKKISTSCTILPMLQTRIWMIMMPMKACTPIPQIILRSTVKTPRRIIRSIKVVAFYLKNKIPIRDILELLIISGPNSTQEIVATNRRFLSMILIFRIKSIKMFRIQFWILLIINRILRINRKKTSNQMNMNPNKIQVF